MFAAPITLLLVAATVLVSLQAFNNVVLYSRLLFHPWSVKHSRQYYRLLSHTLLHADSMHLFFNMFTFWSFGSFLEQLFRNEQLFSRVFPEFIFWGESRGTVLFIILYVGGALVATLPAMRKHQDNPAYRAVGASGAVSAVMMAFMMMFPDYQVLFFFIIPCPAWLGAIVFLIIEHLLSRSGRTQIAHDAHIWGAIFGILFVILLNPAFLSHFIDTVISGLGLA
ncbi:MAG: rhomboid family intramembrane serine protease [Flavobacteriales bacterium]